MKRLIEKAAKQHDLQEDCEYIVRTLLTRHGFLQPANKNFDIWDADDAKEVVADLILLLGSSEDILEAHHASDWGK